MFEASIVHLAAQPRDRRKSLCHGAPGDGDDYYVCIRGVATLPSDGRGLVPRSRPEPRQPAADVSAPDNEDLHPLPPSFTLRGYRPRVTRDEENPHASHPPRSCQTQTEAVWVKGRQRIIVEWPQAA
jgi:hypothetical protein